MDPTLIKSILSGLLSLGGLVGGAGKDQFGEFLKRLMTVSGTGQINRDAQELLLQILNSPGFSQAQRGIYSTTTGLQNSLAQSLGARGLTTSGIGAVAPGLARASTGFQLAGLKAGASNTAFDIAKQLAAMRTGALSGAPPIRNIANDIFGAGLTGLGDVLRDWAAKQKKPTTYSGMIVD